MDVLGSLRLEPILENAKAWALRILKLTPSSYTEHLVYNSSSNSLSEIGSTAFQLEKVKSVVQRAQSNLEELELEEDCENLICLAIVLKEIRNSQDLESSVPRCYDASFG